MYCFLKEEDMYIGDEDEKFRRVYKRIEELEDLVVEMK